MNGEAFGEVVADVVLFSWGEKGRARQSHVRTRSCGRASAKGGRVGDGVNGGPSEDAADHGRALCNNNSRAMQLVAQARGKGARREGYARRYAGARRGPTRRARGTWANGADGKVTLLRAHVFDPFAVHHGGHGNARDAELAALEEPEEQVDRGGADGVGALVDAGAARFVLYPV